MNATRLQLGAWLVCIAVAMGAFSSTAAAQDDADAEGDAEHESSLPDVDEDHPLYWAQMRDVYVMQQRSFLKEGRFAATVYAGMIPNSIFEQYFPVGLRLNYYVLENVGVEISSSYAFQRGRTATDVVLDDGGGADGGINATAVGISDIQRSHTAVGLKWSPVYGKFSFYNSGLFYFDMYLFGGAGLLIADSARIGEEESREPKPEGLLGAGMAVYMSDHIGLRLDYRQFIFQKHGGGVANPSEISLGFSWFF